MVYVLHFLSSYDVIAFPKKRVSLVAVSWYTGSGAFLGVKQWARLYQRWKLKRETEEAAEGKWAT